MSAQIKVKQRRSNSKFIYYYLETFPDLDFSYEGIEK